MSIIRIGTNKQYADGWELVFGGSKRGGKKPVKATPAVGAAKSAGGKVSAGAKAAAKRTGKKAKKKAGKR